MVKELFEGNIQKYGRYDEIEMLPYLVKEQGYQWFIYGAGESGQLISDLIHKIYNLRPDFFVDKQPDNIWGGNPAVYSIEELFQMKLDKCFAVISPIAYKTNPYVNFEINVVMRGLQSRCKQMGYVYGGHLCDPFKLDWYHYIKKNAALFDKFYTVLEDDLSKKTYLDFLKIYITGERYSGITMPEKYKYWGIDGEKRFIQLDENEILLNLGACWGDTIFQYLKITENFRKIIAVEASSDNFERLKRNISLLDKSVQDKIQLDQYFIGTGNTEIDKVYADEGISMINMDIEGAELSALRSAEHIIQKNRPVLALCAYHKKDDLIELPNYIQSIVKDYVFLIRKYPSEYFYLKERDYFHIDFAQQNNELVLYAVPKERYKESLNR